MSNANRDYAIVYDVKNSSLALSRPLVFYITDKNTSNIFVRLVSRISIGDGIDQYTDIENATSYVLTMRVIKPNNEVNSIEATQHEEASIFQFDLTEDFKDIPGKYICELTISNIVSERQELITSDPFNYEVKRSILSNISEIIETEDTTVEKLLNNLEASKVRLFNDLELAKTNLHNDLKSTKSELSSQVQANDNKIENIEVELSSQLDATKAELSSQIKDIVINVKNYGVKGDGITDESNSLQNIFNNNPKKIYFPEGVYKFNKVSVNSKCEIFGTKNTVLMVDSAELFTSTNTDNITIRDFIIDGANAKSTNERVLFFNTCNNFTIKDMVIKNIQKHGLVIIDTSNLNINNINCKNIVGSPILIVPQTKDCYNITVSNCIMNNVAQNELCYGVYFNSGDSYIVKGGTIDNVYIDTTNYGGIFPGGDNIIVSNCNVKNCQGWRGIWIHDSSNIKVIGGTYSYCAREGIYVQKAHNVDIIGVTCEYNRNSGIKIDSDYKAAGRLQGANTNKDVKVIGCTCINNSQNDNKGVYSGINISSIDDNGMQNVQIIGCKILDNQDTKTHKRSIESNGKGDGHIILGNYCGNSIQEGIIVKDATIIEGNYPKAYNYPSFGGSAWNTPHLKLGGYEIWIDDTVAKPRIKNGRPTSQTDGTYLSTPPVGSTDNRPTQVTPGTLYFDSTLNKPIWRNSANTNWIDANGNIV